MSSFNFELPTNAFTPETGSVLLPFRSYASEFLKFVRSFMTLEYLQKLNWNAMTEAEKKLVAPVIIFATPNKAYTEITTPLLNGNLATFGIAIQYNGIKNRSEMNTTPYLLENGYFYKTNEERIKVEFKRPMVFEVNFTLNLLTTNTRMAEELIFRWQYEFPYETKILKVYDIESLIFWEAGSWENNTNLEPATENKDFVRYSTSVRVFPCYYPTEVFGDIETLERIEKLIFNLSIEDINKTVEITQ